jgi:hypothetical protein
LAVHNSVYLFWVPGHTDILGNEEADQLAKLGSSMNFFGPEPALSLSSGWAESIKTLTISEHKKYWNTLESCQQAKLYLKTPFAADKLKHFNKNKLRFLVALVPLVGILNVSNICIH